MSLVDASKLSANAELRARARAQLKGRWGVAIGTTVVYMVIVSVINAIPYIGGLVTLLISGAFGLGLVTFFLNFPRGSTPELGQLFAGFSRFWPAFGLAFMTALFTFLWSLLLIVPGIIAAYRYSQAFYIMKDNPNIGVMEAIEASKDMMNGQKAKLFMLQLSFFWWLLLCVATMGIAALWIYPYMMAALANFYEDLKQASGSADNTVLV